MSLNVRNEFPQLAQKIGPYPLTYLDSAATTLKPKVFIERYTNYLTYEVSNVHRGAHTLASQATQAFEDTRTHLAKFVNSNPSEIIFTSGTTDSINLLSFGFEKLLQEPAYSSRDEIVLTQMEHHSNIVPWYELAKKRNLKIKVLPINSSGQLEISDLKKYISNKTLLVAMVHISNTLGVLNPVEDVFAFSKSQGALTFLDAAQSVSFVSLDVKELGCDFLTFSAHKLFGPEGLGVLYGSYDLLDKLSLYRGGGSMISDVDFNKITYLKPPHKFEAGTPNIGAVISFKKSVEFFESLNIQEVQSHEKNLLRQTIKALEEAVSGFKPLGDLDHKLNILSFNIEGLHASDVGSILDQLGVAVRVGHHCTQPLMKHYGVTSSLRASYSIYNNLDDCENFVNAVIKAQEMLL